MSIKAELEAYEKMKGELELEHFGKWVIIFRGELYDKVFDTEQEALIEAVRKFKDDIYLVAQVGATESQHRGRLPTVLSATYPDITFEEAGAQCL